MFYAERLTPDSTLTAEQWSSFASTFGEGGLEVYSDWESYRVHSDVEKESPEEIARDERKHTFMDMHEQLRQGYFAYERDSASKAQAFVEEFQTAFNTIKL